MKNEFTPYDVALAVKELGYESENNFMGYYEVTGIGIVLIEDYKTDNEDLFCCNAPLYQQAFRWFREEYLLWFRPDYYDETRTDFSGSIHKLGKYSAIASIGEYNSAVEAELACLRKLIEIVNQNKDDE